MQRLTLLGTPLSHFARKVRIVLHELEIPFDFERVPDLLAADAAGYGQNPLMRVPTLIDSDQWITAGLAWLDRELDPARDGFDYVDVATICMWRARRLPADRPAGRALRSARVRGPHHARGVAGREHPVGDAGLRPPRGWLVSSI